MKTKPALYVLTPLLLLGCFSESKKETNQPFENQLLKCFPEGQQGKQFEVSFTHTKAFYKNSHSASSSLKEGEWSFENNTLEIEFPLDSSSNDFNRLRFSVDISGTDYYLNPREFFGYGEATTLVPSTWKTDTIPTISYQFDSEHFTTERTIDDSTSSSDQLDLLVESNRIKAKAPSHSTYSEYLYTISNGELWVERPTEIYNRGSLCTLTLNEAE